MAVGERVQPPTSAAAISKGDKSASGSAESVVGTASSRRGSSLVGAVGGSCSWRCRSRKEHRPGISSESKRARVLQGTGGSELLPFCCLGVADFGLCS